MIIYVVLDVLLPSGIFVKNEVTLTNKTHLGQSEFCRAFQFAKCKRAGCGAWQDHDLEWVRGPPVLVTPAPQKAVFAQFYKVSHYAQGIMRNLLFRLEAYQYAPEQTKPTPMCCCFYGWARAILMESLWPPLVAICDSMIIMICGLLMLFSTFCYP